MCTPLTVAYANPVRADSPFGKRDYLGCYCSAHPIWRSDHTLEWRVITSFAEVGIARQIRTLPLTGVSVVIGSNFIVRLLRTTIRKGVECSHSPRRLERASCATSRRARRTITTDAERSFLAKSAGGQTSRDCRRTAVSQRLGRGSHRCVVFFHRPPPANRECAKLMVFATEPSRLHRRPNLA